MNNSSSAILLAFNICMQYLSVTWLPTDSCTSQPDRDLDIWGSSCYTTRRSPSAGRTLLCSHSGSDTGTWRSRSPAGTWRQGRSGTELSPAQSPLTWSSHSCSSGPSSPGWWRHRWPSPPREAPVLRECWGGRDVSSFLKNKQKL